MEIDYSKLKRNYEEEPLQKKEKPEKEDLEFLYLKLNWTSLELKEYFKVKKHKIFSWLNYYGIKKTREQQMSALKRMWLEKYGVDNVRKLKSIQEKTKKTCLERYGVDCSLHSKQAKEKTRKTNIEKYGTDKPLASPIVRERIEKTCLQKYGAKTTFESKQIQEKIKETWLKHYGVDHPLKAKEVRDNIKQTCLEKYGTENIINSPVIKEKIKKTCLEKYGYETPLKDKEIRKRIQNTCIEKYGSKCCFGNEEIKQRIVDRRIQKYGVAYPLQREEVKQKRRKNNIEKWGTSNISTKHIKPENLEILNDKEKLKQHIQKLQNKNFYELGNSLGITYDGAKRRVHEYELTYLMDSRESHVELDLGKLLDNFKRTRLIIPPYEIDLFNEELKLGIEYNGTYWHSTLFKEKKYHQNKSKLALEKGIFIYHIFEYEWNDLRKREIILSQLSNLCNKNSVKIGARKCTIKQLGFKECSDFLEQNHLQGKDQSTIRYGLLYKDELVSVMTFCKPRSNKNYQYELSRFCCKRNYTVIGGASRLFKYFLSNFSPKTIISYSDIAKTKGNMYNKLGFKLNGITTPNYKWILKKNVLSRYEFQKHNLEGLSEYGSTEDEIMKNIGALKIYDCGNKVWVYQA